MGKNRLREVRMKIAYPGETNLKHPDGEIPLLRSESCL